MYDIIGGSGHLSDFLDRIRKAARERAIANMRMTLTRRPVPQIEVRNHVTQPFPSNSWTAMSSERSSAWNDQGDRRRARATQAYRIFSSIPRTNGPRRGHR